jgi:ADP-heptose:LPS heptosyltransferase
VGQTLVIHPGAVGDVLLTVPALRALRRACPDDEIVLAAQSHVGELLRALGVVEVPLRFDRLGLDALFTDGSWSEGLDGVGRAARVVCWFGANDEGFVRRLTRIAPGAIIARPGPRERDGGGCPVWSHLLATVGGSAPAAREAIIVPADLRRDGRRALEVAGWDGLTPLLVAHPGAGGATKRWPAEGFAQTVEALASTGSLRIVVHEGPADRGAARALRDRLSAPVLHLDGPSLPTLAGALAQAKGYVGNDSGISHLAASVGTRSVVLFTRENLAWRPWGHRAEPVVVGTDALDPDDVTRVADAIARLFD